MRSQGERGRDVRWSEGSGVWCSGRWGCVAVMPLSVCEGSGRAEVPSWQARVRGVMRIFVTGFDLSRVRPFRAQSVPNSRLAALGRIESLASLGAGDREPRTVALLSLTYPAPYLSPHRSPASTTLIVWHLLCLDKDTTTTRERNRERERQTDRVTFSLTMSK